MNNLQRIRLGLLTAKLKLDNIFTRDWEKDPNPENWRTINGSHVHLVNGRIDGGAGGKFRGNEWHGQKAHGSNSFFPRFNYQQNLFGEQEVMPSMTMQKETNRQNRIARRAQRRNERYEAKKAAGLAKQAEIRAQREDPKMNKNHPYWKTPEGKAQTYFDNMMLESRAWTQSSAKKTEHMAELARERLLKLNSAAAGINQKIDRLNQKRTLTKEDEKELTKLKKQRQEAEHEANAFATAWQKWKKDNNIQEKLTTERKKLENGLTMTSRKFEVEPAPEQKPSALEKIAARQKEKAAPSSERPPIGIINKFKGKFNSLSEHQKGFVKAQISYGGKNPDYFKGFFEGREDRAEMAQKVVEALKNKQITPIAAQNVMAELMTKNKSVLLDALTRSWGDNKNISTNAGGNDIIKAKKANVIGAKSEAHGQGVKAALDRALAHGKKTGNEMLAFVGHDGKQVISDIAGNKNSAGVSSEEDNYLRSLSVSSPRSIDTVHNHPSGSSFSCQDLRFMCSYGCIDSMRVIGHNGVEYCVRIGEGKALHPSRVNRVYMEEKNALQDKYQRMVWDGKDPNEAWFEHSNEIMERLAKKLGWEYERRVPNERGK